MRSLAVPFLFFFKVLSKMGTYLPVSISNGRIPVLNCGIRERRRRDIHLIIYVSGSNISLNIMYVLNLGGGEGCGLVRTSFSDVA